MKIEIIPAYHKKEEIRTLFGEYTEQLAEGDAEFRDYLKIQHYDEELEHPEKKYGFPGGRLYMALCDGNVAGCVALRQLDEYRCEMKRLYVRERYRGKGIGNLLTDRLICEARKIGYRQLLLDTFPFLERAVSMYRTRGFQEIEKYNDSPMASTIYMKLEL